MVNVGVKTKVSDAVLTLVFSKVGFQDRLGKRNTACRSRLDYGLLTTFWKG